MIRTKKLTIYLIKFACHIIIFLLVASVYIIDKDYLTEFMTQDIQFGISPLHLLWAFFMVIMILHLVPSKIKSMALLKSEKETYVPVENFSEFELLKYVQDQNRRAWNVMLVWLSFNAIWGILYLLDVIHEAELLMLTVFYFLCDYICILLYCPFQSKLMKNKCCINCRIYDWGHFMMFTPMLFIKNFFSWSLFFTSIIVLIKWEIVYAKHPERFYSGSNQTLQCANCKEKTCQIKKRLAAGAARRS